MAQTRKVAVEEWTNSGYDLEVSQQDFLKDGIWSMRKRVKDDSKISDLSNWKDEVAIHRVIRAKVCLEWI